MRENNDAAQAERLSSQRARMLVILGVIFIVQQAVFFGSADFSDRAVDHVRVSAWLILSIVLLLALTTGGGWIYPRRVRALANDESTRANRDQAFRVGFIVTMLAGIGLYFYSMFEPLGGRAAIHLIMSAGLVATLFRFASLERRAQADG
jgi:hypothetical protein